MNWAERFAICIAFMALFHKQGNEPAALIWGTFGLISMAVLLWNRKIWDQKR